MSTEPPVLLDLDGTLVDSVYFHVIAWDETLRGRGYTVAHWRIHAGIGMGSSRLIPWLLGEHVDGLDEMSEEENERFLDRSDQLRPTHGAQALVADLEERGVPFIVATSSEPEVREVLLEVLGRPDLAVTDSGDVPSSKPAAHLLEQAASELGEDITRATLVGDSPWDAEAGYRLGVRTIAVRCGGFGDDKLRSAGAFDVVDDPRALIGRL